MIHNEPIIVGFTVLNNAKKNNVGIQICLHDFLRPATFRGVEKDTKYHLALSELELADCFNSDGKRVYEQRKQGFKLMNRCSWRFSDTNILWKTYEVCFADTKSLQTWVKRHRKTDILCLNRKTYCTVSRQTRLWRTLSQLIFQFWKCEQFTKE